MTEQGYFLPSGRSISRKDDSASWGVDPTEGYYVPMTDQQISAMIEVRRREELISNRKAEGQPVTKAVEAKNDPKAAADVTDWSNPVWILSALKDDQLSAAVRAVQGKLDKGEWVATGEKGVETGKISTAELQQLRLFHERLAREIIRTEKRMDAIESATAGAKDAPKPDLWADTIDLTGGKMEVRDKDGKVVAVLDITGNNVERWLLDADVKKHEGDGPTAKPDATPDAKPEAKKPN
jgi:hypothetical protein